MWNFGDVSMYFNDPFSSLEKEAKGGEEWPLNFWLSKTQTYKI